MAAKGEFLIAHPIEPTPQEFRQWPIHLTLVPWFETEHIEQLTSGLQEVAVELSPLVVSVRGLSKASGRGRIQNQLLEKTSELQQLHNSLLAVVQDVGELRNYESIGEDFEPRVRIKGSKPLRPSGKVTIAHFSLIQALASNETRNRNKRVADTYLLRGDETTA